MPVPFETLLPYGVCVIMFAVSGGALAGIRHVQNGGKTPRFHPDAWDRQSILVLYILPVAMLMAIAVMERDLRLTGSLRGQTDNVDAPPGFEVNKPWKVEKPFA